MKKRGFALLLTLALLLGCLPTTTLAAEQTQKLVAITFDDGPSKYTDGLLDALAQRDVVVTFFMQGCNAENYPSVVKKAYEAGHQIASHTYDHPYLTSLSTASVQSQVSKTVSILNNATGQTNSYFLRPPYGSYNSSVLATIATPAILWSVDTRDWESRNADAVYNQIVSNTKDGDIVLMHDLYASTIEGALRGIDYLKSQGFELVTVSELLRRRGVTATSGKTYSSARSGSDLPGISVPSVTVTGVEGGQQVTLTADSGTTIYYTTDGSTPTSQSTRYTGPFVLTKAATVRAFAARNLNGQRSRIATAQVEAPRAAVPVISVTDDLVTIQSAGTAYYTIDGTAASTQSTVYTGPFRVSPGTVIRAISGPDALGHRESLSTTVYVSTLGNVFSDVLPGAWYAANVDQAVADGLMPLDGTVFSPESPVTRGMLASVLYRLSGSPEATNFMPYSDVTVGSADYDAIAWAAACGVLTGYADGTFRPDDNVTREQLAVMLYRLHSSDGLIYDDPAILAVFDDSDTVRSYAVSAVSWAVEQGLLTGTSATTLSPAATTTRAQLATLILRYQAKLEGNDQ
jgi:peptidoglycan/xylan/chitin deacetylase (PgdA/CDA1 family)